VNGANNLTFDIPVCAPWVADPESITPAGNMDSGFALRAPRNDEVEDIN
jgi:hypothetical protein